MNDWSGRAELSISSTACQSIGQPVYWLAELIGGIGHGVVSLFVCGSLGSSSNAGLSSSPRKPCDRSSVFNRLLSRCVAVRCEGTAVMTKVNRSSRVILWPFC